MPLPMTARRDGWSLVIAPGNQAGGLPDAALTSAEAASTAPRAGIACLPFLGSGIDLLREG